MNTVKSIFKYIIIIFIGVLIAFLVAWIQYDTQDLSASILSLTEQEFFESTQRDAWYKKEKQSFEVFLSEKVRNEGDLIVSILYSPTDINLFIDKINTNCSINNIEENEGNILLNIDWYKNSDFKESIFEIPYSWDSKDITLEYVKSQNLNFAIWSLDNIKSNNQIH